MRILYNRMNQRFIVYIILAGGFQRGETTAAMKRLINFSPEVKEGRRRVRVEEERVERSGWTVIATDEI